MSLRDLLGEKAKHIKFERRFAKIDGHPIIYSVLPCDALGDPDLSPIAKYFAGKCGYSAFYISEAIPEEFRLPILAHEFYEYREPLTHKPSTGEELRRRHHEAIKHEVRVAHELGILPEYLKFRIELYRRCIEYLESKGKDSSDEKEDFRIFKAIRRRMC